MAVNIVQHYNAAGEKEYPVTTSEGVGMSDGSGSLDKKLGGINGRIVEWKGTVAATRNAVPQSDKKIGMIISYKKDGTDWINEQFIGTSIAGSAWTTENNWQVVGTAGGNKILPWNTDVKTTRNQVPDKEKKPGMIISYLHPEQGWVNEQFIGDVVSQWGNDSDWEQIPNQLMIGTNVSSLLYEDESLLENIDSWEVGILENNNHVTTGYGGHISPYIEVQGGTTIIVWNGKGAYNTSRPEIMGYNFNKSKWTPLSNKGYVKRTEFDYVYVPKGIYWIKISTMGDNATATFKKYGFGKIIENAINEKRLSSNYYNPKLSASGYMNGGTDFIPVEVGTTIFTSAQQSNLLHQFTLYTDKNQESFVRNLDGKPALYTFTQEDLEGGIKYIKAGFGGFSWEWIPTPEQPNNANFLFVITESPVYKPIEANLITQYINNNIIKLGDNVIDLYRNCNKYEVGIDLGPTIEGDILNSEGKPPYYIDDKYNSDDAQLYINYGYTKFALLKLTLLSENVTDGEVEYWTLPMYKGLKTGESAYLNVPYNGWKIHQDRFFTAGRAKGESQWKISVHFYKVKKQFILDNPEFFCFEGDNAKKRNSFLIKYAEYLYKKIENSFNSIEIADYAKVAERTSDRIMQPWFAEGTIVAYGTSITAGHTTRGYLRYIANSLGMKNKNLGIGESVPHSGASNPWSLSPEQLAKMPDDTRIVIINYGANGWVTSGDIDNRETTNSIGAINVAIDYIVQKFDGAVIVLALDNGGMQNPAWADLKRISEHWNIPLAPTWMVDGPIGKRKSKTKVSPDGLHLEEFGNMKMAACILQTIKQNVLIGRLW